MIHDFLLTENIEDYRYSMKHNEIQKKYKDHIFLLYRDTGGSKKLLGDVIVIVFFVNDNNSVWTEADKVQYKEKQNLAMRVLMEDAEKRGISLRIRSAFGDKSLDMNCTKDNYDVWSKLLIKKHNKNSILEYQEYYKEKYKCDEAPIIFAFNKPFRDCAVSVNAKTSQYDELSMISSDGKETAIIHELLHQFGARDLYYPQALKALIKDMKYLSVMETTTTNHIDSLTAYLIGWSDEIDGPGVRILEKMKHYTYESLNECLRREWNNT